MLILIGYYAHVHILMNPVHSDSNILVYGRSKTLRFNPWNSIQSGFSDPIITLFTTIRDRECRNEIHNRTLINWESLSPQVTPVLFMPYTEMNTSSWSVTARSRNWDVRILHALRHRLPLIKYMFQEILNSSTTPFVGYANADILFDSSLIQTLRSLMASSSPDVPHQMTLIVGRRRDANITTFDLGSGDNLAKISQMHKLRAHHSFAQDYFILSRKGLPWNDMPDFVVGRNGYDNWLVAKAQYWNITLIDATETLLAVHQVGVDGIASGSHTVTKNTTNLNRELIPNFNYRTGSTRCARYFTKWQCDSNSTAENHKACNNIGLMQRQGILCHPKKKTKTKIANNKKTDISSHGKPNIAHKKPM